MNTHPKNQSSYASFMKKSIMSMLKRCFVHTDKFCVNLHKYEGKNDGSVKLKKMQDPDYMNW